MDSSVVARISAIAARQRGAIAVKQLRAAGLSSKAQRAVTAAGWLITVEPTVLVVAGSPDSWSRRLQVGLLALDGRGWVSHEAAARLHGLDRARRDAVEFTVPREARNVSCSATVHTTTRVGRLDVVTVDGLRCSSATRTIIDLAHARVSTDRLEAAIDSALRLGLSASLVLERRLMELRGRGRWGARHLDRVLIDTGGHSVLERRFLTLMRRAGLPRPRTQAVQRRDGNHVARVDFLFEPFSVVVEVSGRLGHSTARERGKDAQRRNELTDLGFKVYEYTWAQITERQAWVVETMRRRLVTAGWTSRPSVSPETP
jgi:very-short-patch-repair endonuclease